MKRLLLALLAVAFFLTVGAAQNAQAQNILPGGFPGTSIDSMFGAPGGPLIDPLTGLPITFPTFGGGTGGFLFPSFPMSAPGAGQDLFNPFFGTPSPTSGLPPGLIGMSPGFFFGPNPFGTISDLGALNLPSGGYLPLVLPVGIQ